MMEWSSYSTEEEANEAYKKQNPNSFNYDGKFIGSIQTLKDEMLSLGLMTLNWDISIAKWDGI